MNQSTALLAIQRKLAEQLHCQIETFEKEGIQYVVHARDPKSPLFQVVSFGQTVVVSVSEQVKNKVMPYFKNRTREEVFECPFLCGQTIYYIPEFQKIARPKLKGGLTYQLLEGEDLANLGCKNGFLNALDYDEKGRLLTKIAWVVKDGGEIIGMAGADEKMQEVWEIGVDVKAGYRFQGLATILVGNLAEEILERGILPIYGAASSNVISQAVACKSGLVPAWVSTYKTFLDNSGCFDEYENLE